MGFEKTIQSLFGGPAGLFFEAQKAKDATEDDDISDPDDEEDWWSGDSNKDEEEPSVRA
jgi:hypothetical protein